jgi:hypothetical protein
VEVRFLYIGSDDTEQDMAARLTLPGAGLRWRFCPFGADVAAVNLGSAPLLLIADHRRSGSVLPIGPIWTRPAPRGRPGAGRRRTRWGRRQVRPWS